MTLLHNFTAVCIALIFGALAAISILIAMSMADNRNPPPAVPVGDDLPDLGQQPPEPGSEREANLLLAQWQAKGGNRD